jgi:hypothetical protein
MKEKGFSFFLVLILWTFSLWAEETKPVIRLLPFTVEGIGAEEAQFIESLIQSYAADMGELVLQIDPPVNSLAFRESGAFTMDMGVDRHPDYILSGSIHLDQENRILELEIIKTNTGETVYYTSTHKTTSDLALKIRSLVEAAFSVGTGEAVPNEIPQEILSEARIQGTWRGDTGIEIVRLLRGGTGIAILSSGAQMNLIYRIEKNTLRVTQDSPNTERFYHPLPFELARELSARAEPWQWEFFLYEDGTILRGIKTFTSVRYGETRGMEVLPGTIQEAEWTKFNR